MVILIFVSVVLATAPVFSILLSPKYSLYISDQNLELILYKLLMYLSSIDESNLTQYSCKLAVGIKEMTINKWHFGTDIYQ
jgi:hypothetical protein